MLEVCNIGVVVVQYYLSWLQTTEGVTCRGLVNDSYPLSAQGFGVCNFLVFYSSSQTGLPEYFTLEWLLAWGLTNWSPIEYILLTRLGGPREISPKMSEWVKRCRGVSREQCSMKVRGGDHSLEFHQCSSAVSGVMSLKPDWSEHCTEASSYELAGEDHNLHYLVPVSYSHSMSMVTQLGRSCTASSVIPHTPCK